MKVTVIDKPKEIEVPLSLRAARQVIEKRSEGKADDVIDDLAESAERITTVAEKIKTTVDAVLANQLATPLKNASDAKVAANKLFTSVAGKLDGARKRTATAIETLETKIQPPKPQNAAEAVLAGEVRAALLRMEQAERAKAVTIAIDEGDDFFVSAALSGSSVLTGMGKAEANALAEAWRRKRHGETCERIARLKSALGEYDRLCGLLSSFALGILAERNAAIAAATKSAELAAKAMAEVA
jgi:hypothetical protein